LEGSTVTQSAEPAPPEGDPNLDRLALKDAIDYAWKWFAYHAAQRMQTFNFFLILMGALSVGYYQAYQSKSDVYAAIVASFGAVVAFAFVVLEVRNEELVNVGRNALQSIEMLPGFPSKPEALRLLSVDRKRTFLKSHKAWLRIIELLLFAIFLCIAIKSIVALARESTFKNNSQPGAKIQVPYIKQERRDAILAGAKPQDPGELNFAITVIVDNYLQDKGEIRYSHLNEVIGAMECSKLELYRRLAAPYEDEKMKESGDVYKSNARSNPSSRNRAN
jgi:hypothetical protein